MLSILFVAGIFSHLPAQQTLHLIPYMVADKDVLCPGETATITVQFAHVANDTWAQYIWTESLKTINQNCSGAGCVVLEEVNPIVTGEGVTSAQVTVRRGCGYNQSLVNTIVIKVKPTATTTIGISWYAKWLSSADPGCNNSPEHLIQEMYYNGSKVIKVTKPFPPVLSPTELQVKQADYSERIKATGLFESDVRKMRWFKSGCNGQQAFQYETQLYAPDDFAYFPVGTDNPGTYEVRAQKVDNGCVSDVSAPALVVVKPCGQTNYGCNQAIINDIDDRSCKLGAAKPPDYHFYRTEKKVCVGDCDLNDYWNAYKSDITNQIITQSDQYGAAGPFLGQYTGPIIRQVLFPEGTHSGPMTDDCATIKLPRPYSFAVTLGRYAKDIRIRSIATLIAVAGPGIVSNFDPVFIRISESSKCVTNYTLPGHVFYPGKVTRCLVKDCDTVKILTFGEGTSVFQNTPFDNSLGSTWAYLNKHWGQSMFENVDVRASGYLQTHHRAGAVHQSTANSVGSLNQNLLYKRWRVKDFKIKYPDNDTVFTIYTRGDTTDFWKMSNIKMTFFDNGRYKATSVMGDSVSGAWSSDSSGSVLTVDTLSSLVQSTAGGFTVSGSTNVFNDTVVSTAQYFLSFEELPSTVTWLGTQSSAWEEPANWSDGRVPDESTDVVIGEVTPYDPVINFPTKCKSLTIFNGRTITVKNNLRLTGQSQ